MRTFKGIGLIVVLVAFGLSLAGCITRVVDVLAAPPGGELTISVWGSDGTRLTFTGDQSRSITLIDRDGSESQLDNLHWFYDIPDGGVEYIVVNYSGTSPYYGEVHLLTSKMPSELKE